VAGAERVVRPLRVVVRDEDAQDALEVAAVEDQQPVEAFGATVLTRRSAMVFACGTRTAIWTIRMPPARNTRSKVPLCLLSRSRGEPGSGGVGRAGGEPGAPVACAMKNNVCERRKGAFRR
jgi:hypothetical protein